MSTLAIMLVAIVVNTAASSTRQDFIHRRLNNTGIYFEKLENLMFYTSHFEIITSIDVPDTTTLLNSISLCKDKIQNLCNEVIKADNANICKSFIHELNWQIEEATKQNKKIAELYGRTKRSLIDAGGKLAKFLFGTMDSEDEQKIYSNLESLNNNQEKLIQLQQRDISVIKSNYNSLVKPVKELQNETYRIELKLNEVIEKIKGQNTIDKFYTLNRHISEMSSLLLIKCSHITRQQTDATEIILALKNHILHPQIIPYATLTDIIKKRNHADTIDSDIFTIKQIKNIAKIDHITTDGKIIIRISIPYIQKEKYQLFKVFLTPFTYKNKTIAYSTDVEYIATNDEKDKFVQLKFHELQQCKTIESNLESKYTLCEQQHQIITDKTNHCIPTLLYNPFNITTKCMYTPAKPINTMTKLVHSNTWLYSMSKKTKLIITCNKETQNIEVINEGTITFITPCTIITKEFTIQADGFPERIEIRQPEVHQITLETTADTVINETVDEIVNIKINNYIDHNTDFKNENRKINNLEITANSLIKTKHEIISHRNSALIFTTMTIITLIMIATAITIKKLIENKKTETVKDTPIEKTNGKLDIEKTQARPTNTKGKTETSDTPKEFMTRVIFHNNKENPTCKITESGGKVI